MTCGLLVRSPVRFCLVIALLGGLDEFALHLAQGYAIRKIWIDRLGIVLLPFLWIAVGAIARAADDAGGTWQALRRLASKRIGAGALAPGACLAALHWIFVRALQLLVPALNSKVPGSYLQHPGEFLESIATSIVPVSIWVGACYFPLLALVPDVSADDARRLSKKASGINGELAIWTFTAALAAGASVLVAIVPAYGMTDAAFIVFMGTLNYVAYRDIFEGRRENIPTAIVPAPSGLRRAPRTTPVDNPLAGIGAQVIRKLRRPLDPPQRKIGALSHFERSDLMM